MKMTFEEERRLHMIRKQNGTGAFKKSGASLQRLVTRTSTTSAGSA